MYPQAKRRKETDLAGEVADSERCGELVPAALWARTPRHVGISGNKKGPEIIRALLNGGAAAIEFVVKTI